MNKRDVFLVIVIAAVVGVVSSLVTSNVMMGPPTDDSRTTIADDSLGCGADEACETKSIVTNLACLNGECISNWSEVVTSEGIMFFSLSASGGYQEMQLPFDHCFSAGAWIDSLSGHSVTDCKVECGQPKGGCTLTASVTGVGSVPLLCYASCLVPS